MAILNRQDNTLTGWYLYLAIGRELRLDGRIDPTGDFQLDETVDSGKTGRFQGRANGGRWTGEWLKTGGGRALAFTLTETRDTLAALSGQFRCSTKKQDKVFGWTYAYSLNLSLARGAVRAFDARLDEASTYGESQGCGYALRDFSQVPSSDVGILLKAKDEDQPETDDLQRCTIRIVGDADYLFLQIGDFTEKNNNCRFSGATAFCSSRSWMSDMIVNRKTQSCKSVGD